MRETIETFDPKIKEQQILATRVCIMGSIALFLISAVIGIAVDSITLMLDASASLVILAVAFLMNVSIKKIHSPPDNLFNFGYGKYEPLTLAVQGGLIIATCVISIKFAIQDIIHLEDVKHYGIPMIATFISGIIGIFIVVYLGRAAKRTRSQMISAARMHWVSDTLMSFGVCVGFLSGYILQELGFDAITPYIDPVMAIILALMLVRAPLKIIMHNVFELLDAVPPGEIRAKVAKAVEEHKPGLFETFRLRSRKAGERIFIDVCFMIKESISLDQIQELTGNFERELKKIFPVSDIVVYFKSGH